MILACIKKICCRFFLLTEFCHCCGVKQPVVWTADDELWKTVTGITNGGGVYCPNCFNALAEKQGIFLRWVPHEEK